MLLLWLWWWVQLAATNALVPQRSRRSSSSSSRRDEVEADDESTEVEAVDESTEIELRNVAYSMQVGELRAALEAVCTPGAVASVDIPTSDASSRVGLGQARAVLSSRREAVAACESLDGAKMKGRRLAVSLLAAAGDDEVHETRQRSIELNRKITSARSREGILEAVRGESSPVNVATALHRLALLGGGCEETARLASNAAKSVATEGRRWESRQLASAAWSAARLSAGHECYYEALLSAIATEATPRMGEFQPQGLANLAWAMAKGSNDEGSNDELLLYERLAVEARRKIGEFTPQALANTAWAFSTKRIDSPALYAAIAAEAALKIDDFQPQDCANVAWAFATAKLPNLFGSRPRFRDRSLFEAIARRSEALLATAAFEEPQALANLAWAFTTAGYVDTVIYEAIAARSVEVMRERSFKPQEIANLAWALSKAGYLSDDLLVAMNTIVSLDEFEPRHLAMVAWSLGHADLLDAAPELTQRLSVAFEARWAEFDGQALANVAWAMSKAGKHGGGLAKALQMMRHDDSLSEQGIATTSWALANSTARSEEAVTVLREIAIRQMPKFRDSRALATVAWSFATLASKKQVTEDDALFRSIAVVAPRIIASFSARELAKLAWSFAHCGRLARYPALARSLERRAVSLMTIDEQQFSLRDLATLAWAYASFDYHYVGESIDSEALFGAIASKVVSEQQDATARSLAMLAWSLGRVASRFELKSEVWSSLAAQSIPLMAELNPQDLANTAWSYSSAAAEAPELYEAIATRATATAESFKPQELANTAWAFATAGLPDRSLFEALALNATPKILNGEMRQQELAQLHQTLLFCFEHPVTLQATARLLTPHADLLREAFVASEPQPSRTQRAVSDSLSSLGWDHVFEFETPEGLRLDMAQPHTRRAVEFYGPSHYLGKADSPGGLNGQSRFKQRLLRALGWSVAHVPYYEWDKLPSPEWQADYLTACLANQQLFFDDDDHQVKSSLDYYSQNGKKELLDDDDLLQ